MPIEVTAVRHHAPMLRPAPDPLDPSAWGEGGDVGAPGGDDAGRGVRAAAPRRRSGGDSPTARTLRRLRAEGWTAEVVERWNPHARVRNDLFGFVDVLAVRDGVTLAVQATSGSNAAARVAKIGEHQNIGAVRKAGWRIEVWAWRKLASSGKWECRVVDVS